MQILKTGDIVELKSGGPKMTVKTRMNSDLDSYECQWFNDRKLKYSYFKGDSLKLLPETETNARAN
jgi:uncharacterized protein YodC (DUF2158 family)